ncbi:MAG TPA: phenylalanine--tRNA ligase subunit beta [Cytophagales bacterium]|nr:phenylalanine--tRNA ligase subunit beta [Cytophagales bacterium]HAA21228.1 phenylalanine--tRNA ligase subunit beta [Cytophagales bacterium]HAP60622.1 phenylalanine--tRNA ligase subunit beta [Cytophagales bacterium]
MKISYRWLQQYIDLPRHTLADLDDQLTQTGLEVEGIEKVEAIPGGLRGVVIGEVLTAEQHPNADKLRVTTVDIGAAELAQIVCGAPNVAAGQKVVVATVGSTLYPTGGEPFKIKKSKIRGEVSLGMICAEDEIGVGTDHDGIMVLDTELANGAPAADYFNLEDDHVIEIGLTPNRADAASHIGVARDLKALHKRPLKWPDISDFKVDSTEGTLKVRVDNYDACPRFSGLVIKGLTVKESPQWLRNRLSAIGLAPINNVVDVTNFVLHELGQPLHAYDVAKITTGEVVVRTYEEGTKFTTLDEKERALAANDLMVSNGDEEGMCIAGVFGGIKSGVSDATTSIFLESAYFAPDWVRRTVMRHGLKTDAGYRFERGIDPNGTIRALKRAALLIKEVAGGSIASEIVDLYPKPIPNFEVPVKYANIERLMGISMEKEQVNQILTDLDIEITQATEEGFVASVPPYRVDVTREADIVEEVLRIYGINNIPLSETLGTSYLADFPEIDRVSARHMIIQTLTGLGYQEFLTNALTKKAYAEQADFLDAEKSVTMVNPLSEELNVMRQTMLFGGLESLANNIRHKQTAVRAYEIGRTYQHTDKYQEFGQLAIWLTGEVEPASWMSPAKTATFHDLKKAVLAIWAKFNLPTPKSLPVHEDWVSYGLDYQLNDKTVVRFGKVKSEVAQLSGVNQEVFYAEWDWDLLLRRRNDNIGYSEVSRFPAVQRDLSLVLDGGIAFQAVAELAKKMERKLLTDIQVFDVYEGDKIEEGKKAYAMTFTLQDQEKTLTDKVIDKTMGRLMQAFERELGAVIRK